MLTGVATPPVLLALNVCAGIVSNEVFGIAETVILGLTPPDEASGADAVTLLTGPVAPIFCVRLINQFSQIGLNVVLLVLGSTKRSSAYVGGAWKFDTTDFLFLVVTRLLEDEAPC